MLEFKHQYQGHEIIVKAASFSGKVTVFYDGKIVSSRRSFRLKTKHTFEVTEDNLRVAYELYLRNRIMDSLITCTLVRDGNTISGKTIALIGNGDYTLRYVLVFIPLLFVIVFTLIGIDKITSIGERIPFFVPLSTVGSLFISNYLSNRIIKRWQKANKSRNTD